MDNARKKLRVCLICVVMAAVVIGLIYYLNDMRSHSKVNEGTLVDSSEHGVQDGDFVPWGECNTGEQESRG